MRNHIKVMVMILLGNSIFQSNTFSKDEKDIAIILKSWGDVKVRKLNPQRWENGRQGVRLISGEIIKTGDDGLAAVMFTDDKCLLKVRDNSSMAIRGESKKASISERIKSALSKFWEKVRKRNTDFYAETPFGVAAVR